MANRILAFNHKIRSLSKPWTINHMYNSQMIEELNENYPYRSPKDKQSHCRPCQRRPHVAARHSSHDANGPAFHLDTLYQEQPMLWPYLNSQIPERWVSISKMFLKPHNQRFSILYHTWRLFYGDRNLQKKKKEKKKGEFGLTFWHGLFGSFILKKFGYNFYNMSFGSITRSEQ